MKALINASLIRLSAIAVLLFSSHVINNISGQPLDLAGTYTIDPSGGAYDPGINDNFLSFSEAVDSLISRGIGGNVVFNVADGFYDERFIIPAIPGSGPANMITFQSASLDSSSVYLNYSGFASGVNSRIIHFNGASYITIRQLGFDATGGSGSYGQAIWLDGGSHHIYVENNNFIGKSTGLSSINDNRALIFAWGNNIEFLEFRNNRFIFGEDGIKLNGTDGAPGLVIEDNMFFDQVEGAIYIREHDAPIIRNNTISLIANTRRTGIQLELVDKGFEVSGNEVILNDCNAGIFIRDCDGNPGDEGKIVNNFVANQNAGGSNNHGIWVNNSTYIKFYHNSVYNRAGWITTSRSFYQENGGNNLDIRNNCFVNKSAGYSIYITNGSSVSEIDFNNYFTNGNFIGRWGSNDRPKLADFVSGSSDDANSISADPRYFGDTDLHLTNYRLESKGTNLTLDVPNDIDGEVRSSTPDIGADEFVGTGAPLSGEYFIGGTSPDYNTPEEATQALKDFGISAPVIFSIRDDDSPYDAVIHLDDTYGASESNTITFRPDPSNTGNVIIAHDGSSGGNQTVHLVRASHVVLENLTFSADNSSNSTVIRLNSNSENVLIRNCIINSLGTSNNNASIYSIDDLINDITIEDNTFTGGTSGININALDNTSHYPTGIVIRNNTFSDHYISGIFLQNCNAPDITDNIVLPGSNTYNYWGIYLNYCTNNYGILRNRVLINADDGGIVVNNCSSTSSFTGKIHNNYVEMDGSGDPVNGIYTLNSSYVEVFFNTSRIFQNNSNGGSNAYSNTGGGNIRVLNNIFVNYGSGRAFYNDNVNSITESDYNNIFSSGTNLARIGSNEINVMEEFQSASGSDANSLNINPWFEADQAPEINSSFLDGAGTPIIGVSTDIYELARQDPPDIGAVEYTASVLPLAAGTYTVGGDTPDYSALKEALVDLQLRGIAGPVELAIRPGNYNEHISTVNSIPGSGPSNRVVVRSETGNPEDVKVLQVTDNDGGPYNIFSLKNVSNFTMRDFTISSLGNDGGRPVGAGGTYSDLVIDNMILTSGNTTNSCLVIGGIFDNVIVKDNAISGGYGNLYIQADDGYSGSGNIIQGNRMTGGRYYGISIKNQYAPKVINNTVENILQSGFEGIRAELCTDEMMISGNRINNNESDHGIFLVNCDASSPYFGLVSNNFIHVGGTYWAKGIYLTDCRRTNIYHNSILITSTHNSNGRGIELNSNNSEISILNNVIANTNGSYTAVILDQNDISEMDYNNLWSSTTGLFGYLNSTVYEDFESWKSGSGWDMNSVSSDPMFISTSDLHSYQIAHHENGTALPSVAYDIDSIPRDPAKPDLGAAEFYCQTPEFNIFAAAVCLGDTTEIIDSSLHIAPGSSRGWDLDGDLFPDVYTTSEFESFEWVFEEPGTTTITYIVQQIAGCNDFTTLDIFVTPEPELEIETTGAYCDTDDGAASVTVTNLEGPFEYYWSTGETESSVTGLALGNYTVAVSDETGCTATSDVTIGEAIEVTVNQLSASTCGVNDGSATVNASGGIGPYTYVWSNGFTEQTNDSLTPGPNYVNVIDSEGCYAQGSIDILSIGGPQIEVTSLTSNDCYNGREGSIDISVSSGVEPYDILWSNGAMSEDIDNLAAGIYNVVITDADGCRGSGSFQVSQPSQMDISPVITPATCEGADGSAVAVVSGGTKPYAYEWSTGGIFQIEEGLAAGVYSVTVTDGKGCQTVEPVIVNNINAPEVTVADVQGVGCTITDNGSITVSATPVNPFYNYSWSNGGSTPTITGLTEGVYEVTVSDDQGCTGVARAEVTQVPPDVNPICIVTVDTITGKNLIAWEKLIADDVSHYNIYRETSVKGQYQLIDSIGVDETSEYIDAVADPTVRSWRYKLSVVNLCGEESELSLHHKTMHLTINQGLNGDINLIWDQYEGFLVTTYKIWRYDADNGWMNIADVPSNLTSYTDQNAPTEDLTYYIEVPSPGPCITSDKKAGTLNFSRSNRRTTTRKASSGGGGIGWENFTSMINLNIFPNPGSGKYILEMNAANIDKVNIEIFDIAGKIIASEEFRSSGDHFETTIDLSGLPDGIYQLHLRTGNNIVHRMLLKE